LIGGSGFKFSTQKNINKGWFPKNGYDIFLMIKPKRIHGLFQFYLVHPKTVIVAIFNKF